MLNGLKTNERSPTNVDIAKPFGKKSIFGQFYTHRLWHPLAMEASTIDLTTSGDRAHFRFHHFRKKWGPEAEVTTTRT